MKKLFMFFVLCLLTYAVLNFTPATQSAYTKDAEARLESFKKAISLVVRGLQGVEIVSWQETGRVARGVFVNIEAENGDKESVIASLKAKLVEKNFIERGSFFCRKREYVDFSSKDLDDKSILLYWHYPDDECPPE